MSISSDEQPVKRIRPGCLWSVLITIGVIVLLRVTVDVIPAARHSLDGDRIDSLGKEFVAELDSYGPIEPATGRRLENSNHAEYLAPVERWGYNGEATFATDAEGSSTAMSTIEARDAFVAYLEDNGWTVSSRGPKRYSDMNQVALSKGPWTVSVLTPIDMTTPTSTVLFSIVSPNTAWF